MRDFARQRAVSSSTDMPIVVKHHLGLENTAKDVTQKMFTSNHTISKKNVSTTTRQVAHTRMSWSFTGNVFSGIGDLQITKEYNDYSQKAQKTVGQ